MLDSLKNFFLNLAPVADHERPKFTFAISRGVISLFVLCLPFLFDVSVPEVAGDIRWYALHLVTLALAVLGVAGLAIARPSFVLKLPLLAWLVLAVLIWAAVSLIDTLSMVRSWWFFKHFAAYCLFFFLIFAYRHEGWYRSLLWLMILPVIPISLLATAQYFTITDASIHAIFPLWPEAFLIDFYKQSAPPGATFANKNLVASWLMLVLPIAGFLLFEARRWVASIIPAAALFIGLTALMYTRSRSSWVALILIAIAGLVYVLSFPSLRQLLLKNIISCKTLVFILVTMSAFMVGQILSQSNNPNLAFKIHEHMGNLTSATDVSVNVRKSYNLNNPIMVRDYWFNGVGIGAFHTAYPLYHDAVIETHWSGYGIRARPQRAHNDLMQAFTEIGVLGGLLYLAIITTAFFLLWRLRTTPQWRVMHLGIGLSMLGLATNSLMDFPLQMPTAPILLFGLYGIALGLAATNNKTLWRGWRWPIKIAPIIWILAAFALLLGSIMIWQENYQRRQSAQQLKFAMSLVIGGVIDDRTLRFIDRAYKFYSYNSRLLEYRGVIYSTYNGSIPLPLNLREEVVSEAIRHDPYGANNLINQTSIYFRQAQRARQLGDEVTAQAYADKIFDVVEILEISGKMMPHPYSAKGYAHLIKQEPALALPLFQQALTIDPDYQAAQIGLANAQRFMAILQQRQTNE